MQIKTTQKYHTTSYLSEWSSSKEHKSQMLREDVDEREASYTVGKNIIWCSHCGKQYEGSSKN